MVQSFASAGIAVDLHSHREEHMLRTVLCMLDLAAMLVLFSGIGQ